MNEADRADYVRFLLAAVPGLSLDGKRVVIDCANGAASAVAPQLFAGLRVAGRVLLRMPVLMAAISMSTAVRCIRRLWPRRLKVREALDGYHV